MFLFLFDSVSVSDGSLSFPHEWAGYLDSVRSPTNGQDVGVCFCFFNFLFLNTSIFATVSVSVVSVSVSISIYVSVFWFLLTPPRFRVRCFHWLTFTWDGRTHGRTGQEKNESKRPAE